VRPHADDLYLGVAAAIIVVGAVVATMFLRRFDHRPRVGGAIVAVMVLLVLALALAPGRVSDVAARNVGTTALRDGPLRPSESTVPWPAPPMRRVPIPTTSVPPAPPAGGAGRAPSAPPPSTTTP
jgi:hypothetical protein